MKVFLLVCIVASALAAEELKIDQLDYEAFLNDEARWKQAFNCLMDKAPCGDMQELKDHAVKRLESHCTDCTPQQFDRYTKALKMVQDKYPKDFDELMKKINKKA